MYVPTPVACTLTLFLSFDEGESGCILTRGLSGRTTTEQYEGKPVYRDNFSLH